MNVLLTTLTVNNDQLTNVLREFVPNWFRGKKSINFSLKVQQTGETTCFTVFCDSNKMALKLTELAKPLTIDITYQSQEIVG